MTRKPSAGARRNRYSVVPPPHPPPAPPPSHTCAPLKGVLSGSGFRVARQRATFIHSGRSSFSAITSAVQGPEERAGRGASPSSVQDFVSACGESRGARPRRQEALSSRSRGRGAGWARGDARGEKTRPCRRRNPRCDSAHLRRDLSGEGGCSGFSGAVVGPQGWKTPPQG